MASEAAAAPVHSTVDHVEEKKVDEIKENVEHESVPQSKEDGGKDETEKPNAEELGATKAVATEAKETDKDPKVEESPAAEAVATEPEKKDETPTAEAVVTEIEEKDEDPKVEETPTAEAVVTEIEEKDEDPKVEETPTAEEAVTRSEEKDKDPKVEESPAAEAVVAETEEKDKELKVEESPAAEVVVTEPEEKDKDPKVEETPTAVAAVTEIEEKYKDPKVEETPAAEAVATEPEEKTEVSKVEEASIAEYVVTETEEKADEVLEKIEESSKVPVSDIPVDDVPKCIESLEQIPAATVAPETAIEVGEKVPEEQTKMADCAEPLSEVVPEMAEVAEKVPEEQPKKADSSEPSSEAAADKVAENSETSPSQETELKAEKDVGAVPESPAEAVAKVEETKEISNDLETTEKQSGSSVAAAVEDLVTEAIEEVEKKIETPVSKESTEAEIPVDEKSSEKTVEAAIESLREETSTKEDPVPQGSIACLETVASDVTAENSKDDEPKATLEPEPSERVVDSKKEERGVSLAEQLVKEAATEAGMFKELVTTPVTEITEDLVKSGGDVAEVKSVKTEEPTSTETDKTKDVGVAESVAVAEVFKTSVEGETDSRDVKIDTEEKKREIIKIDAPASVETPKDREVDVVKVEEAAQTTVDATEKLEEKKEELEKTDDPKDSSDTKTDSETIKPEVSIKTTHRQSNNIMSKVKQSIVKVKKAIIGKSPSSKTLSTEAKDDIKVK